MGLRDDWKAISARIEGLVQAGHFYLECLRVNSSDTDAVAMRILIPEINEVLSLIKAFRDRYASNLSTAASKYLENFIHIFDTKFENKLPDDVKVRGRITALASFRSGLTYHLSDHSAIAKRLTDRAFIHLQRSIVADEAVRSRWKHAYSQGETACERLGAVHLLQHGIWAFKATGERERTDLVMGERLASLDEAERVAEALVLTEWKLVREAGELDTKLAAAKTQVSRYASGVLGGFELAQCRYLVIVSERVLQLPQDESVGDVRHRHINIAVDPLPPSRQ